MAKRDIIRAAKRAGYKVISADYYWTTSPGERVPEWQVVYQDTAEVFEQEVETFDDSAHAVSFFEGLAGEVLHGE